MIFFLFFPSAHFLAEQNNRNLWYFWNSNIFQLSCSLRSCGIWNSESLFFQHRCWQFVALSYICPINAVPRGKQVSDNMGIMQLTPVRLLLIYPAKNQLCCISCVLEIDFLTFFFFYYIFEKHLLIEHGHSHICEEESALFVNTFLELCLSTLNTIVFLSKACQNLSREAWFYDKILPSNPVKKTDSSVYLPLMSQLYKVSILVH